MRCITSVRFNMRATLISQGQYGTTATQSAGHFANRQNPITFEIERVWVETDSNAVDPGVQPITFACIARGIVDGGIRVAGTTERILPSGQVESVDYVRMQCLPTVPISKRDRVYNIIDGNGLLAFKEEEYNGAATVFEVIGVTPIFDPFGSNVENHVLLQRAEVQKVG